MSITKVITRSEVIGGYPGVVSKGGMRIVGVKKALIMGFVLF